MDPEFLETPFPREEFSCASVPRLRLGWTLFDARDPGRTTPTQAEALARHHVRRAFYLRQVHGTRCVVLSRDQSPSPCPVEADGILTDRDDLLLGVSAADCLPVYLVSKSAVAVLHAGWRGVLAGLVPLARQRLQARFGIPALELELYLGPHIGACCFQVSPAVWTLFAPSCRLERHGALYLDMAKAVEGQWRGSGGGAVHRLGRCTYCSTPTLHSYRRDGGAGRNFAYLYYS